MWARVDGDKRAKIDLVREGLRSVLGEVAATARYGMVSFGHRRSGDCSDIEVIAPIRTADAVDALAIIDKLNPRGKGPVADALVAATEALEKAGVTGEQSGSIILVHDNADNCKQDPCEAANAIHKNHPKVTVHLVSLALDGDEAERMACVAQTTGGTVFAVNDAKGVREAIAGAFKLAVVQRPRDPSPVVTPPVETPLLTGVPTGPPRIVARAHLSERSPPLNVPVVWRVTKVGAATALPPVTSAVLELPIDAGRYAIDASVGFASGKTTVDVAPVGATAVDISLEAAALNVGIKTLRDGARSPTAFVTLGAASSAARPLWVGRAADANFIVPAGRYELRVVDGLSVRTESLALAVGEVSNPELVTGTGRLELAALAKADGEALEGVTFIIARDDPQQPDGRREIARSAATRPAFILGAGTYYVTARIGMSEVRQRIGIGAGDTVKRSLTFGFGKLIIEPQLTTQRGDVSGQALPVSLRVLSLENDGRQIFWGRAPAGDLKVAAGRYRIEGQLDTGEVKASQDVEVEAGGERRVALKFEGNALSLGLEPSPVVQANAGTAVSAGSWEVRDARGAIVARSTLATPTLVLPPGRYGVRYEVQSRISEKMVDIASDGQPRRVLLPQP